MKVQRIFATVAAASLLLTGCTQIQQEELEFTIAPVATTTTQTTTTQEVTKREEVALEVPEITQQEVSILLEAEDAAIPAGCSVSIMPRLGYSGTGYLSGLRADQEAHLTLSTEIPATQHYDITVVVGSEEAATCQIRANGETVYTMTTESAENFVRVTVQGIFLAEGTCELAIVPTEGQVDVDCVELVNNTSLYSEDSAVSTLPVNPNASANAKALYQYLRKNYGEKMVTGQYVSDQSNAELEEIYQATGEYPLIRFADMGEYSRNGGNRTKATAVDDSLRWAEKGGVVGLSWMWNAPTGTASVYADKTEFSLSSAMTSADVATATEAELLQMKNNGTISESCYALIQDIDAVAEAMQPLAEADVPVLWRPLMEAGGGWYWWGADGAEAYCWLWDLMYTRMTEYHKLNNLLWIWNGQSSSFLIDESQFDIASLDLYVDKDTEFGSRYEQYVATQNMTSDKILAISECSNLPDLSDMFRDNAVWSFFGLWYAPYLGEYVDNNDLIALYHSAGVITLSDYIASGSSTSSVTSTVKATTSTEE